MISRGYKLVLFLILVCFLCGCSLKEELFVIPASYSGEAVVKVYVDNRENTYNVKVKCYEGNYSFDINEGSANWNISIDDDKCTLINDKFKDNFVTIDNSNFSQGLIKEFDLEKFNNSIAPIPKELIYWDGTYKHVLNFSKENLLPENIFIYKNDNLVKTIQYNKLDIE